MANNLSKRDASQVLREAYDEDNRFLRTVNFATLVPEVYDNLILTYVAAGNGAGEVETVTYKNGTDVVGTLTLTYDASDRLITVIRS